MFMNKNVLSGMQIFVAASLLVINIGLLIWFLFFGYESGFHSDSAAKVLLAREIIITKDYFPDDWNYVNNDLFVFFGHTFIIPLLGIMPAGFTAHAISGLIFSTLLLTGVWFVSGLTVLSVQRRLLILAVAAAGVSGVLAENLYGQVSYGVAVVFYCYLIVFSWNFFQASEKYAYAWGAALFLLLLLAYWENPQRATMIYGLPFLGSVCWLSWQGNSCVRKRFWQALATFSISIGIGSALHVNTLSGVNNIVSVGNANWLPYELMLRNLSLAPLGILSIFGGLPTPGDHVVSKTGIYDALRLVAAVTASGLIPWATVKAFRHANDGMRFFGSFLAIAFTGVFFIYVTTTIGDMSDPVQSSRYLIPPLFLGLVLLLMNPIDRIGSPVAAIATAFIIVFFITSGYSVFRLSGEDFMVEGSQPGPYNSKRKNIVDFLISNNLQYGYATFWNAGVSSVLSDEKTLVRQVWIKNGIPIPMQHLSSNRWYQPKTWHGETFLLLTEAETRLVNWDAFDAHNVKPDRSYEVAGFMIYVFKDNLANHLPGWDTRPEIPLKFKANKNSLKQTGHFDGDKGVLVAEKSESGALHYGPYVTVKPGHYAITFDVLAAYNQAGAVRLDVASAAPHEKIHTETTLSFSDHPQRLYFTLNETQTMEFRVWALGNERVMFKGVTIERLPSVNNQ